MSAFMRLLLCHGQQRRSFLVCGAGVQKNPKSPDFKHKVTRKAVWVDGWSTPPWVKAMLKWVTKGKLQSHVGHHTGDCQEIAQPTRLFKDNVGRRNTLPTSARGLRQSVQGGSVRMHIQSTRTMSEVIFVLKDRLQQNIAIDLYTYVEVLKRCLKEKDLVGGRQVHDCIIKSGMEHNIFVANNLLIVFDELVKKDIISWNVMIGGYAQHNCAEDAMEVYKQMQQEGVHPNGITYMNILKACMSPSALKWGEQVHAYIRHGGLESDVPIGTALLKMYAKCGSIKETRKTFDKLASRNVISWNEMIRTYSASGCGAEAYGLFLQMIQEGFKPDAITFMSILNPCASAGALEWVKEVHKHACEAGFESDVCLGSVLVHMYAKCGSLDDAQLVFDNMADRDVITWTVMIGALAESGCGVEAYQLFLQMICEGLKPDKMTCVSILNPCASEGVLEWVKDVHSHALKAGLESNVRVGNALVHMYAKSGSIDDARLVFERMHERDAVAFNVMIGGLAQHGCGYEALEVYRKMVADGVRPDRTLLVVVLLACSHAGLVDEGRQLFVAMSQDYGIEPTVVHCTCMVDLFGRAGHLEEAKLFIDKMPIEPNRATWGVLLGACRSYDNVELGELATKERANLDPLNASMYVLLSNIYAAVGMWQEVALVRTMM